MTDSLVFPAGISVRKATPGEAEALFSLIDALAEYEQLAPPNEEAKERLQRDLFGVSPRIEAYLGWYEGAPAGYAIILETYSSFLALPTLYLEDIFVLPHCRNKGVGIALFAGMAALARERGCGRMEWTVLDWNVLAQSFYQKIGARHMHEWQLHRLDREGLDSVLSSYRQKADHSAI